MRYDKYAMPVDPRVLKKDFETDSSVNLNSLLRRIGKLLPLKDANPLYLKMVNEAFYTLWAQIDNKVGINLSDRENLVPHFTLMGKLVRPKALKFAYRGVRLSSYEPKLLSQTYPAIKKSGGVITNPQEIEVLSHLEGLAYGLRSWTDSKGAAANWALGNKGNHVDPKKDKVVFICPNPNVLFDVTKYWDALDKYHEETERWDIYGRFPFDYNEKIIYLQNPKIQQISFDKNIGIWYVTVSE